MYFHRHLVFLRVKECVAKLPFPFDRLSSVLDGLVGAVGTGAAFSSWSSIGLSVSTGGSHTTGMPVEVDCARTLEAVGPSAGSLFLVRFGFCFLSASLDGVSSL